jgi:hypothetical protein
MSLHIGIVVKQRTAIARVAKIELEAITAVCHGVLESFEGILGGKLRLAPTQAEKRQRTDAAMAKE